jgi:hypothetical protein
MCSSVPKLDFESRCADAKIFSLPKFSLKVQNHVFDEVVKLCCSFFIIAQCPILFYRLFRMSSIFWPICFWFGFEQGPQVASTSQSESIFVVLSKFPTVIPML